jgi:hypothetical protein
MGRVVLEVEKSMGEIISSALARRNCFVVDRIPRSFLQGATNLKKDWKV